MANMGRHVFGLAAIGLGLVGLCWGDFANTWQPVPEGVPARQALAYAAAIVFLLSGAALQWRRAAPAGALAAAALYLIFAFFWAQRAAAAPQIFGVWLGLAEQIALVIAGIVAFASVRAADDPLRRRIDLAGRLGFGLCLLVFGAAHFVYVPETAGFVPDWIPPNQEFWALATGAAHIAAGLAILAGRLDVSASRLLVVMFVGFGALVWAPQLIGKAGEHMVWGGNAVNFALIGAAWVIADGVAARRSGAET